MKKILATLLLGTALAVAALPVSAAGADNAVTPVSYTHLDVYKRQRLRRPMNCPRRKKSKKNPKMRSLRRRIRRA